MDLWLAFMIVGTINDHWWAGSQTDFDEPPGFNPELCGPCAAVRDMPAALRREAVRTVMRSHGGVPSTYWDVRRNDFREGVDFTKPGDIDALCAEAEEEQI